MNRLLLPTGAQSLDGFSSWLVVTGLSILASLAVLLPFFWLGSASGHDFEFHVASWLDVAYQWRHGVVYPHWTAWTNFGFGEPRYIFYPPLSWMLGAALTFLVPISWVPAVFVFLTQILAGLSAFLLLRRLVSARATYLGAAFYAANPYALLNTYIRSDFAEQLACAFFPLLLLSALRLATLLDKEKSDLSAIPAFALPFAAVWLSNAPAGVIASYAMALLFAAAALLKRSWSIAVRSVSGLALGLGLSAFYLLPAAYEQRWINIAQALSGGLLPSQNFLFTRMDDVEHTWFNWIASICALAVILMAGLTALASRKMASAVAPPEAAEPLWRSLLLLGAVATLLMISITSPAWTVLPKLRFVQFPWRWMSILAVIGCCFFAAAAERRRGWLWFALYVGLAVPLGHFLVRNTWWDADEMTTQQAALSTGKGYEGVDEYDPLGDDHLDLPRQAPVLRLLAESSNDRAATPPAGTVVAMAWLPNEKWVLTDSSTPARLALRLLNYPAWRVTVNDRVVEPERPDDTNQMVVPIPAGHSQIKVVFTRTPDRTTGIALSLLSLLVALLLFCL